MVAMLDLLEGVGVVVAVGQELLVIMAVEKGESHDGSKWASILCL